MKNTLMNLRNRLTALLLGLAVVAVIAVNPAHAGMELQQIDGTVVDLDEYRGDGKWLLVMLWATDCPICEAQKPEISAFHEKHKDGDAQVLGIALDGMENVDLVKANMEQHQTSFPSLIGNIAIVASHYQSMTEENLRGTPTYLLFNPEGELVGNNPGLLRTEALEQFIAQKSG